MAELQAFAAGDLPALRGARPGDARPRPRADDAGGGRGAGRARRRRPASPASRTPARSPRRRDAALAGPLPAAARGSRTGSRPARSRDSSTRTPSIARRRRPPRRRSSAQPLDERYVSPLPGPRLVTLPSPFALAKGTGVTPQDDGRRRAQAGSSTRSTPSSSSSRSRSSRARSPPTSTTLRKRSRRSAAARGSRSGSPSATRERCSSRAWPTCRSRGSESTSTRRICGDVPDGFLEAAARRRRGRAQLTARGAARARGLRAAPRRARGANRARPERRPPVRLRADRPREARAPRQGQGPRRRRPQHDTTLKFLTHEIGSLAKPPWLVKTSQGRKLEESDIEHARTLGREGGRRRARGARRVRSGADDADPDEVARWSSRYCVRLQESAGVEVIWDGEQLRSEMYAWAIEHSNGFEPRGTVRSFDNKYYSKSAAVGPVGLREPYHNEEFSFLQSVAKAELKIPITGAYTLAVWSLRRAPHAEGGPPRRRLRPLAGDRGAARADARHRAQPDPPEPRGADRPRRDLDPDRRAGRLDRGRRARPLRRELQRQRRGARLHVLDAPLLLRLRPLLPGDRGHERLPPVLRRLRQLRQPRARHHRAPTGRATR